MASYGALVQSTARRTRILDADVRVGDYKLDSTHAIRASDFDFSSEIAGHPVPLPLSDDETALRTVAWAETDRRYEEAAERLVKIRTQRTLKVADDDPSDDFSREKPNNYFGPVARLNVDVPVWEDRLRRLSGRFRGQAEILDSDASLQATSLTEWLLNSEGTAIQSGRNYVRVFIEADARADDGMELERQFESFDAESAWTGSARRGGDGRRGRFDVITDLKALAARRWLEALRRPGDSGREGGRGLLPRDLRPPGRGAPAEERRGGTDLRQEDWRAGHAVVRLRL